MLGAAIGFLALAMFSCSSSNKSTSPSDSAAPATIHNLAASNRTATSITLT
jgi:hypothetical protein